MTGTGIIDTEAFFTRQMQLWPACRESYELLEKVMRREVTLSDGTTIVLQCNPSRIASASARTDASSVAARPCFLCTANRPVEQISLPIEDFLLLVNPFPIFSRHFVLASAGHTPQRISGNVAKMARFAAAMPSFTLFYNGPQCGASAPDHLHFQAVESEDITLWHHSNDNGVITFGGAAMIALSAATPYALQHELDKIIASLPMPSGAPEPPVNLLIRHTGNSFRAILIPRRKHRPECFYLPEPDRIMASPASVDLTGTMVLARQDDFRKIFPDNFREIISQVAYSKAELTTLISKANE